MYLVVYCFTALLWAFSACINPTNPLLTSFGMALFLNSLVPVYFVLSIFTFILLYFSFGKNDKLFKIVVILYWIIYPGNMWRIISITNTMLNASPLSINAQFEIIMKNWGFKSFFNKKKKDSHFSYFYILYKMSLIIIEQNKEKNFSIENLNLREQTNGLYSRIIKKRGIKLCEGYNAFIKKDFNTAFFYFNSQNAFKIRQLPEILLIFRYISAEKIGMNGKTGLSRRNLMRLNLALQKKDYSTILKDELGENWSEI